MLQNLQRNNNFKWLKRCKRKKMEKCKKEREMGQQDVKLRTWGLRGVSLNQNKQI